MDHHFASSWLKSLSAKLDSLQEWSWDAERQGTTTTHRQLFREFFSAPFQKTLALVDEQKKGDFLRIIEKNLYKFDPKTQQFPLGCLCALLQHGKDSSTTQEKVSAWVDFILDRLRSPTAPMAAEVAEECLSAAFLRLLPCMRPALAESLADALAEHVLPHLDEASQRRLLEGLELLPQRIEALVVKCTEELNAWYEAAPCFPATPLALADALARAEHPLLRYFTAVRHAQRKEAFLVAVALCLQSLKKNFAWMRLIEPVLERLSQDLQQRLFYVQHQGPVMDLWLSSRLKKYNGEASARVASIFAQPGVPKLEPLKALLLPFFPQEDGTGNWLELRVPSKLADAVMAWLVEGTSVFLPQHSLSRETLLSLLHRTGRWIEVDPQQGVRLAVSAAGLPRPEPPKATPDADVDNLIDLLMQEALAPCSPEMRSQVQKISHGVYRINGKEATLHTISGSLFVYRIGDSVQHKAVQILLAEEGLMPPERGSTADAQGGPVDTSSVARIAQISQQTSSAGARTAGGATQPASLPFGLGRPAPPKPQELLSKRVEAATRAADVAKQVLRRQIDFEDEEKLRKLLIKGLKHDEQWSAAYQEYCSRRRVSPDTVLHAGREFMSTFVEQNLPNAINTEWAQKVIHSKKEKKEKKPEKKEKKKDRKRELEDATDPRARRV